MDLKCKDPGGLVCRDLGAYTVVYFSLFSLGSLIAISLQIGFPIEENFSSYSVITFPAHMTGSWCRSKVWAVMVQPASGIASRE